MEKNKYQKAKNRASYLLKFFTAKTTTENFESVKIKDSEIEVEYAELVVGASVSISSSTGSEVAPDKEYSLVNGAVFVVKDSLIESILSPADEAKEEVKEETVEIELEEEVETGKTEEVSKEAEHVKALEDKIAKMEEMIVAIMDVIELQPSKEDVESFNKKVEALSKVPTQLSADNREEIKESQLEKFAKLAERYTKK